MTEGTKSYLIGCHQFLLHPLWVLLAWRLEYSSWPEWWELVCILLHDIGICGRQYLSDDEAKKGHWMLGAWWANLIVWKLSRNPWLGQVAACECAGHCPEESSLLHAPIYESKISRADKRSRLVAPMWWTWWEYWVEFSGIRKPGHVRQWKKAVAENLKRKKPLGNHELHLSTREWREK